MTATVERRRAGGMLAITVVAMMLVRGALAQQQSSGGYFLPGDAKQGLRVFFDKGCARCHAVLGEGGQTAPDLARAPAGHLSAAELLAAMWNHAPAMWEKMKVEGVPAPTFSEAEMANLFAFLYSVRSLDPPGDPVRGRQLLSEKRCLHCHAVGAAGSRLGPSLENWAAYRNPVSWIQAMWNHGPAMQAEMAKRNVPWPEFRGDDIADLIAYLRKLSPRTSRRVYLRPADPEAGRTVFRMKGCSSCHSVRGRGGVRATDLAGRALPRTLGQFAADMWNHAPKMWASMRPQHAAARQFTAKEMSDLIAYLFAERYFEAAGDRQRGRRIFDEKGCGNCHGRGAGPTLTQWRRRAAPIPVAAALWSHGPLMLESMHQQQIAWPRFRPGEMADLLEFLDQGQAVATTKKSRR